MKAFLIPLCLVLACCLASCSASRRAAETQRMESLSLASARSVVFSDSLLQVIAARIDSPVITVVRPSDSLAVTVAARRAVVVGAAASAASLKCEKSDTVAVRVAETASRSAVTEPRRAFPAAIVVGAAAFFLFSFILILKFFRK